MSLNKEVTLTGNLGRDPQSKFTPQGKFICEFSIAVTVGWGDNKSTEWYKCVAWEKTGEIMNEWLHKGSKVQVRGDFKLHAWTPKDGGDPRAELVVTVKEFQFLSPKNAESETPFDGEETQGE